VPTVQSREKAILRDIRGSRIILPLLLGLVAVGFLVWQRVDWGEMAHISWNRSVLLGLGAAVCFLVIHHLSYAYRLYSLSEGRFTFRKCIELIFIWEFSSAVSPTSVGGSAVAFYMLSRERLPFSRTATIVLYTIVLDGLFFLLTLPLLFAVFGGTIIRPDLEGFRNLGGWGNYFVFSYVFMFAYTFLFFYGLFLRPVRMQDLLKAITALPYVNKWRPAAENLGKELVLASGEMRSKPWAWHLRAILATAGAWSTRFLLLLAVILAFSPGLAGVNLLALYARLEAMFLITLFSPTPGGSGFAEVLFGGFLEDYIPSATIATLTAAVWRLLGYYVYVIAGAIIVPVWLRQHVLKKRAAVVKNQAPSTDGESASG